MFQSVPVPKGHVLPSAKAKQALDRLARQDTVTWLGHASVLLRIQGSTILTDPFLSETAGPFGLGPRRYAAASLRADALPPLDVILISQGQYDHLDLATLHALPNKQKIDVITPLRFKPLLQDIGFKEVIELDWYEGVQLKEIQYTALPSIHFHRRHLFDGNRRLWASYSIKTPNKHIFFSGDSAYGKVFSQIGARMGPFDMGLVNIGGYAPRRIKRAAHAAPEEAVQIGIDIGANTLIATHWGTIRLSTEPPFEPPERFRAAGVEAGLPEENLWVMKIGETRALPK